MYYKPVYIVNNFQPPYNIKLHMQHSKNQPTSFKKAFILGALFSCSFADSFTVPLPTYMPATTTIAPAPSTQLTTSSLNPVIFAGLPAASTPSTTTSQPATVPSPPTVASTSSISQNNGNQQSAPVATSASDSIKSQADSPQYPNFEGSFSHRLDDGRRDDFPSKNGNYGKINDSTNVHPLNATQSNSTVSSNQNNLFVAKIPQIQEKDRWSQGHEGNAQGSERQPHSASNTTNLFHNSNQARSSANSKIPLTAVNRTAHGYQRPSNGQNGSKSEGRSQGHLPNQREGGQRQARGNGEKGVQNNRRQGNDRLGDRDNEDQHSNGQNRPARSYDDQENQGRSSNQGHSINQNRRRYDDEDEDRNEEQGHSRNQNRRSYNDEDDQDDGPRSRRPARRHYDDDEEEDEDRYRPSRRNERDDYDNEENEDRQRPNRRNDRDDYEERRGNGRSSRRQYDDDEEEEPRSKRSTRRYEDDDEEESRDWNSRSSAHSNRRRSNLRHYD